jgi:hypothetical protein
MRKSKNCPVVIPLIPLTGKGKGEEGKGRGGERMEEVSVWNLPGREAFCSTRGDLPRGFSNLETIRSCTLMAPPL